MHLVCLNDCDLETSTMRTPRSSEVVEPWGKERENRVSYCYYVYSQKMDTNRTATIMWRSAKISDTKEGFSNQNFWEPLTKEFLASSLINCDQWPNCGL